MKILREPRELNELSKILLENKKTIGLVPTMGALHIGHSSLVKQSLIANDCTIVTLFVNPLQFNNQEDLDKYPSTFENDFKLLDDLGCDYLFAPSTQIMYASKPLIKIDFGGLDNVLEGEFRPGHFSGVGVVVAKLLNMARPTNAYFGLKDLQQFLLIKKMVEDLSIPVNIQGVPTVRATSGLALSSRNLRLSDKGLEVASRIYVTLNIVAEQIRNQKGYTTALELGADFIEKEKEIKVEYLELVDPNTLKRPDKNIAEVAICFAGYVEGIRLIDNLYLRQD
ncbi:MAG: pantoate--beta-alanine ligase [Cyclobacteriaceae bacterium]